MCFRDLFCTERGNKCLFVEIAKGGRRGSQDEPGKRDLPWIIVFV